MSDFQQYQNQLSAQSIDLHPSELHGRLTGYLCAVRGKSNKSDRLALYAVWLGQPPAEELAELLEVSFDLILENLDEFADFDFNPVVPDDDVAIADRVRAVALWCGGFLSALGEAGYQLDQQDSPDVAEVMRDMARIAAVTDQISEGEENEVDLMEIIEFVRVSTLLIFADATSPGPR